MDMDYYGVLDTVAVSTSSELILFVLILAVIAVPLYAVVLKGRKAETLDAREREKHVLDYIKGNTEVLYSMRVLLNVSKADTKDALDRIHTRIDEQLGAIRIVSSDIARVDTKIDNLQ